MALHRRQALQLGASGLLAGLAGCADLISRNPQVKSQSNPHSWPQFRGGPVFGGTRPAEAGPGDQLSERWAWRESDIESTVARESDRIGDPDDVALLTSSSPVVLDETVVVEVAFQPDHHRCLVALDGETGDHRWTHAFDNVAGDDRPAQVALSPALLAGCVYHVVPAGEKGLLVALDIETGDRAWSQSVAPGTPVIRDDMLYVISHRAIAAFDVESQMRDWKSTDVSLTNHRAAVTDEAIIAMDGAAAVAYDRDGGDELWRERLVTFDSQHPGVPPFTAPVVVDGHAVAARSKQLVPVQDHVGMVSFDPGSGTPTWGFGRPFSETTCDSGPIGTLYGYPLVSDGLVFVCATGSELIDAAGGDPAEDSLLLAFDVETEDIEWSAPAPVTNAPVLADDFIYLVGQDRIAVVSRDGEEVVATEGDDRRYNRVGSPVIADGRLYVPASDGGGVVAFEG